MVNFDEFARRFGNLPDFIRKEGRKILKQNEKLIVDMQTGQHHKGVNIHSEQMQGGYSTGYGKRRKKSGLQTSFVDLHFSGKFHKSLKVVPAKGGVDVKSNVDYEKYLRGNFPGEAGLTATNAEQVAEIVANLLAVQMKKFLVA